MIKPQLKVNPRFETLLTFVLLIASSALLFGQISEQQLVHYDIEDGLPSKVIYSVQQDSSGFIWISTDVGITLFDGHSFRTFTTKDGLPSNDVVDADYVSGRLWLNSLGPLSYISEGFTIQKAPPISSVDFTSFIDHEFAQDGDDLWISRANEIYLVDNNTLQQKPIVSEIYKDSAHNWVFEHDG
ncbi:MAG: hypothetical protein KI786_16260, partial [Mameliella sp.]|nr:hypothetical protein [Phaeodactylibacter sp.]